MGEQSGAILEHLEHLVLESQQGVHSKTKCDVSLYENPIAFE